MDVRPEDWHRLKEVFEGARALPAEARPAYLAAACATDEALRRQVELLLDSHERARDFLETPAVLPGELARTKACLPVRIGRYRITDTLGEGGMGVVYAAFDEQLARPIAVKIIRADRATEPLARERFWREARLAASVNHPHICQLYEIGETEGQLFIAMEQLEGESLAVRLRRGAIPATEAIHTGLEVLAALEALHRRGITHRDLKPSNIFLTPHGVKLLDFGVALPDLSSGTAGSEPLTLPGAILGTPTYMAPEQLHGAAVDGRADLFALGAILYEMLSGTAAFKADTDLAIIDRVLHGEVAPLGGSTIIVAADRVVNRALAKSPEHRYLSAAAMAEDLRMVLGAGGHVGGGPARNITRLIVLPFRLLRPDTEIDFLSFSLADAITHTLSPLESLVVRSTLVATRFDATVPDLQAIAKEASVDVVLTGTLLRAGDAVRVTAQLLEASDGTVLWSDTAQVSRGDIFQLQDSLVRHIVESLTLPLSGREHRALRQDVPSSARAYEFYLRANPLSYESGSWEIARDLYQQCLQLDSQYAPAWARLGRVHHLLAKYRAAGGDTYAQAESALNRALEVNPDLSMAVYFYAQLEVSELGRAREAMARLVRRASSRRNSPELFAALVPACRYCGLLKASLAADDRAKRLDPNVRTSVQHTFFMVGDYLRAAAESEHTWGPGNIGALALQCAGHPDTAARLKADAARYANTIFAENENAWIRHQSEPNRLLVRSTVDRLIASGFRDPEGLFYQSIKLAHAGDADRAVEILCDVVDRGFFPFDTLMRHAWLDGLRDRQDFQTILQEAERRHRDARMAFIDGGGETLLGVTA
jgi:serine/threonine protein kinase/tetratricopeptide (TPR) repeat protein